MQYCEFAYANAPERSSTRIQRLGKYSLSFQLMEKQRNLGKILEIIEEEPDTEWIMIGFDALQMS
ncbi:MAG: hypothetical protein IJT36_03940 [Alphaproteobacteria bacterium]|nr:hypothetical protein [Alphaproteobacteria bacterium]